MKIEAFVQESFKNKVYYNSRKLRHITFPDVLSRHDFLCFLLFHTVKAARGYFYVYFTMLLHGMGNFFGG